MSKLCAHIDLMGVADIDLRPPTCTPGATEPWERRLLVKGADGSVWSLNLYATSQEALLLEAEKSNADG